MVDARLLVFPRVPELHAKLSTTVFTDKAGCRLIVWSGICITEQICLKTHFSLSHTAVTWEYVFEPLCMLTGMMLDMELLKEYELLSLDAIE